MTLLAHQGGWDELLIFAVPAVLAVLGLRWVERRARSRREQEEELGLRSDEGPL